MSEDVQSLQIKCATVLVQTDNAGCIKVSKRKLIPLRKLNSVTYNQVYVVQMKIVQQKYYPPSYPRLEAAEEPLRWLWSPWGGSLTRMGVGGG